MKWFQKLQCKLFGHDFFVYQNQAKVCERCGLTIGVLPKPIRINIPKIGAVDVDSERGTISETGTVDINSGTEPSIYGKSPIDSLSDELAQAKNIEEALKTKTERRESMPKAKFFLFEGKNSQWYFHLKASNGKIICQSEGYTRKENALGGIESVKKCAASAEIEGV